MTSLERDQVYHIEEECDGGELVEKDFVKLCVVCVEIVVKKRCTLEMA